MDLYGVRVVCVRIDGENVDISMPAVSYIHAVFLQNIGIIGLTLSHWSLPLAIVMYML